MVLLNKKLKKMKKFIKDLKKGELFIFNKEPFMVKQKFSDWKKDDNPYLKTTCGKVFWYDELEVCPVS
jgi:hypothetical protein